LRHEGYTVFIPPTDESFYTFNEVLLEDNYRLGKIRRPLGTVVDLGANIGLFAAKVVSMAERVICVEPVASNLAIAQRNAQHSDFPERVSFHNRAIAGQTGETIKIFLSDGNRGGHSIREDHADRWGCQGSEDAMTISLADLFDTEQIERCALLKCDIEGSEFEVFEAAPLELLARIDSIVMEVHLTSNEWNLDSLAGLRAKLKQAGFRVECEVEHDGEGRPSAVATLFATNLRVHGTPHSRKRNQSAAVHRRGP